MRTTIPARTTVKCDRCDNTVAIAGDDEIPIGWAVVCFRSAIRDAPSLDLCPLCASLFAAGWLATVAEHEDT